MKKFGWLEKQSKFIASDVVGRFCRENSLIEELTLLIDHYNKDLTAAIGGMPNLGSLELTFNNYHSSSYLQAYSPKFHLLSAVKLNRFKVKIVAGVGRYDIRVGLAEILLAVSSTKNITELCIIGKSCAAHTDRPCFLSINENNPRYDFPNLRKLTINAGTNYLAMFYILPHLKNLSSFLFSGLSFDNAVFTRMLQVASRLQMVNIVVNNTFPSLVTLKDLCFNAQNDNLVIILRKNRQVFMQAHQHSNGIIFYPSQINDDGGPIEQFEIGDGEEFHRALEIADCDIRVRIVDEEDFAKVTM